MTPQILKSSFAEVEDLSPPAQETVDVYCWRAEQLLGAGYSPVLADALAMNDDIDLHVACDLLARGCDSKTAFMILA